MIVSLLFFKIMVWGSIIISALLMIAVFLYFLYEIKKNEVW
ncbi:hypothetical protein SAMN04488127_0752 [Bhargavaea ginsengi]|uniref:Uncharacterized protein n=1 Tax=Bhargavaea ginsengi TaxID=426757 RepID=A0A1H6UQ63_9BACL|nr:hypothetical protein SAMN04488127_0752 [Bhargavaea ginsengi]